MYTPPETWKVILDSPKVFLNIVAEPIDIWETIKIRKSSLSYSNQDGRMWGKAI